MFGLGVWEIAIIAAIAALIFGPARLPKLGRGLGDSIREFRKAGKEISSSLEETIEADKVERNE